MRMAVLNMWLPLLLSITVLPYLITAQRACYFPDGTRASDHMACSPEAEEDEDTHSACCSVVDNVACLSSKLCINQNGFVYRGSCTDRTWTDKSCPSAYCTYFSSSGMNILPCNDVTRMWCCAEGGSIPCCQNENKTQFSLNPGTVTYVASTVSLPVTSSTSSAETTTTSDAATTTSSEPSATAEPQVTTTAIPTGTAVGMGIGIALPTVLAIVFAALWWIERAKRKRFDEPIIPPPHFTSDYHQQSYGASTGGGHLHPPELHGRSYSSELSGGYDRQPLQSADALELSAQSVKPPGYTGGY
ncbi:hypothetical protein TWF481_010868 [Arthrobotrys musiformis]|uniref:Mid2 domain-containing protein n=1 Tax=Arthrobotrys musiformis TaxID=47236 RepID=A0AAV9W3E5_9PEZI